MKGLKELKEKRNDALIKMDEILNKAQKETRALSEDEKTDFEEKEKEVRELTDTIKKMEEFKNEKFKNLDDENKEKETREMKEEKAFGNFLRGETRALDKAQNGAVIPSTISSKILETLFDICPIYAKATRYNLNGDLTIPRDDDNEIDVAIIEEFEELTENSKGFSQETLKSNITGVLSKVSNSLINNAQFDIVGHVVGKIAKKYARFFEKTAIKGCKNKKGETVMTGAASSTNIVTLSKADKITSDELIDMKFKVKKAYQKDAFWIMTNDTFKEVSKLKDANGVYLLGTLANGAGFTLLGKSVEVSDAMDELGVDATPIIYGDMSGIHIKLSKDMQIQVLTEKYATQYAIGVVGFAEIDCKLIEEDKICVAKCPTATPAK